MKTAFRLGVSVAFAFTVLGQTPPKDVDGWGKIKWGMTIAEARSAYSVVPKNDDSRLTLDPVQVGDISMAVWVEAKKGTDRINKVELSKLLGDSETFDRVKTLLIQKYGRPVDEETKIDEVNARVTTVLWTFPSTSILLTLRQGRTIFLDYTATDKKALDAL